MSDKKFLAHEFAVKIARVAEQRGGSMKLSEIAQYGIDKYLNGKLDEELLRELKRTFREAGLTLVDDIKMTQDFSKEMSYIGSREPTLDIHKKQPWETEEPYYKYQKKERPINEAEGSDYWGTKVFPEEGDGGIYEIRYYGGPGHLDVLCKARNNKFVWRNWHNDFSGSFKTDDYELIKTLCKKYGGEPCHPND